MSTEALIDLKDDLLMLDFVPARLLRGLRSSGTSPQTFRSKVEGRGDNRGSREGETRFWSILLPSRSAFSPEHSHEQHFCFLLSAKGAGCVSAMWINSPRRSRPLSEVYAFARHCCLWRHQ